MRRAGHGCRILYYLRTTPRDLIPQFVSRFDHELRDTLEEVLGLALDDAQWEQASFPSNRGWALAGQLALLGLPGVGFRTCMG